MAFSSYLILSSNKSHIAFFKVSVHKTMIIFINIFLQQMIAYRTENQYWKIRSSEKKNFMFHNACPMEGIIECNAIRVIAGVCIRIQVSRYQEHPRRIGRRIVIQFRLPVDP